MHRDATDNAATSASPSAAGGSDSGDQSAQSSSDRTPSEPIAQKIERIRLIRAAAVCAENDASGVVAYRAFDADSDALDHHDGNPDDGLPDGETLRIRNFRLLRRAGAGGQSVVYQAVNERTGRHVALKLLRAGVFSTEHQKRRFLREIELLAALNHPNIVTVFDCGEWRGDLFLVTDFVEGRPLDRYLAVEHPTLERKLRLFLSIASIVETAHARGVIHRDLKPANILVTEDGTPFVIDFGLAAFADAPDNDQRLTNTGEFVGSLPWAAPEQFFGAADLDVRTDVWGLGAILYQSLTDTPPRRADCNLGELIERKGRAKLVPPRRILPSVPPDLDAVCMQALRTEPENRYQTVRELSEDVKRFLETKPIQARRPTLSYLLSTWVRRRRFAASATACLILFAIAYAITTTVLYTRTKESQREALRARNDAAAKYRIARSSLGWIVNQVAAELRDVAGVRPIRRAILEGAYSELTQLRTQQGESDELLADIAITEQQLGDVAFEIGQVRDAEKHFRNAIELFETSLASNPSADLEAKLSIVGVRLGDIFFAAEEYQAARPLYERALIIDSSLVADFPNNEHYQSNLAWSHERLGRLFVKLELNAEAGRHFEHFQEYVARLGEDASELRSSLYAMATAKLQLHDAAARSCDWITAQELASAASRLSSQLIALEPTNAAYLRQAVIANQLLAESAKRLHDNQTRDDAISQAAIATQTLIARDGASTESQRLAIWCLRYQANNVNDPGDHERAIALLQQALELSELRSEADPDNIHYRATTFKLLQRLLNHKKHMSPQVGHDVQSEQARILQIGRDLASNIDAPSYLLSMVASFLVDHYADDPACLREAERLATRAIEISPQSTSALEFAIARVFAAQGDAQNAWAHYQRTIDLAGCRERTYFRSKRDDIARLLSASAGGM